MAEYIAGSEQEFVKLMNEKAASLEMTNTNFLDCCGLSSDSAHHTTARDVAIMSRELITKYPVIYDYTQIWMEDITHVTRQGSKEFTLSSTNKLLKQYQWTTGLKTGSTSTAKYCFSATANKNDIDMIAVIMGAPDYKVRFSEAQTLLEYGFGITKVYTDENDEDFGTVDIVGGKQDTATVEAAGGFRYLDVNGIDFSQIDKTVIYSENITAPLDEGAKVGEIVYSISGKELGRVDVVSSEAVEKAYYIDYLKKILIKYMV
jgi:D-alanyl-D-alanine carboxypeptidase (penicillin-binding protein 5/6)